MSSLQKQKKEDAGCVEFKRRWVLAVKKNCISRGPNLTKQPENFYKFPQEKSVSELPNEISPSN